jgi:hypothetical protein
MSTWPNRGVPPAAWQGPEDKKQQPKTHSPNRLTHRNTDSPPRWASNFTRSPCKPDLSHDGGRNEKQPPQGPRQLSLRAGSVSQGAFPYFFLGHGRHPHQVVKGRR